MKKKWIIVLFFIMAILAVDLLVVLFHLFGSSMIQKRLKVIENFSYEPFKEMLNDSVCIIDEYSVFYKDTILEYNCLTNDSTSIMIIELGVASSDFSLINNIVRDSLSQQKNINDKDLKYFVTALPPYGFVTNKPYFAAHNVHKFDNNGAVSQINMVNTSRVKEKRRGENYRLFEIMDTNSHIRFYKNNSNSILLDIHYTTIISTTPCKTYISIYECSNKLFLIAFAIKSTKYNTEPQKTLRI